MLLKSLIPLWFKKKTDKLDKRNKQIYLNTLFSFIIKGGNILIGLVLVPLTLDYIDSEQYGIWLTVSSIVSWMMYFDIGMGHGLRNLIASYLAIGKIRLARVYISTTYILFTLISILFMILFTILIPLLNWNSLLNISSKIEVREILYVVFYSFCIQFVVQIIITILLAVHNVALSSLITLIGQLFVLIAILILRQFTHSSLTYLVFVLVAIPILINIIASIILYYTKLKEIRPSLEYINFKVSKTLVNLGGEFFIIQVGTLILFQTDNIVIAHILGPKSVTEFNISYKIFSVATMAFSIIVTPYWSSFTEAYTKKDLDWIRSSVRKVRLIWGILVLIIIPVLTLISKTLIILWLGETVNVPNRTLILMGFYVTGYTCVMLNCYFLNGIGKLRVQLYLYIFTMAVNIPISLILASLYGVGGVILSNIGVFAIMSFVLWIQVNKLKSGSASGVWNT